MLFWFFIIYSYSSFFYSFVTCLFLFSFINHFKIEFLKKYSEFQQKKSQTTTKPQSINNNNNKKKLDLPSTYDDRYKINFSILVDTRPKNSDQGSRSRTVGPTLPEKDLLEFRRVLHLFENFAQKKSFGKLLKIRTVC